MRAITLVLAVALALGGALAISGTAEAIVACADASTHPPRVYTREGGSCSDSPDGSLTIGE